MIRLTDRLQCLADSVPTGSSMADIGTDHGKLPVYLLQRGVCERVVLTDIGRGPLDRALETIESQKPPGNFSLRQGDGLSTLEKGEVDVVVIAGMGGALIASILNHDKNKTASFSRLILQPRNGKDKLRHYLLNHGIEIVAEDLVREGKYFCEIIIAAPEDGELPPNQTEQLQEPDLDLALEVSPLLFQQQHPLLIPFLENKIAIEQGILEKIRKGTRGKMPIGSNPWEQEQQCKQRIHTFKALMNKAKAKEIQEGE